MKKPKNGIEIVSLEQRIGRVRLRAPFDASGIVASDKLAERLKDPGFVSQWGLNINGGKQDNFNFQRVGDVMPKDEDYIFVPFRALSKTVVPGHWIDWTKDDVLKNSASKLLGQTVYPNHDFTDINNWLGAVQNVAWDEEGARSEGVPGINAIYKIDALMNARIARGLLMTPPAIHSTSMTVLFKFEFSHPEIATESRWRFYELLGEEVEGQIVRFIVTDILEYWEASLVFQGADRLAKQHDDEEDDDFTNLQAAEPKTLPPNSNEEKTMKLTTEQKTTLGIEFDGEDVPEAELLKAGESNALKLKEFDGVKIAELKDLRAKAKAGEGYIEKQRTEVTRLAKLAELGADEDGDLDDVVSQQIAAADFDTLVKLEGYYQKKVGEKFPDTARSSQEDGSAVDNAGGGDTKPKTVPKVGLH